MRHIPKNNNHCAPSVRQVLTISSAIIVFIVICLPFAGFAFERDQAPEAVPRFCGASNYPHFLKHIETIAKSQKLSVDAETVVKTLTKHNKSMIKYGYDQIADYLLSCEKDGLTLLRSFVIVGSLCKRLDAVILLEGEKINRCLKETDLNLGLSLPTDNLIYIILIPDSKRAQEDKAFRCHLVNIYNKRFTYRFPKEVFDADLRVGVGEELVLKNVDGTRQALTRGYVVKGIIVDCADKCGIVDISGIGGKKREFAGLVQNVFFFLPDVVNEVVIDSDGNFTIDAFIKQQIEMFEKNEDIKFTGMEHFHGSEISFHLSMLQFQETNSQHCRNARGEPFMFYPDQCDYCGICLTDCQWMTVEKEEAETWIKTMIGGERTPAVDQCVTCYACNERCPQGANPFDLIASLQEKYAVVAEEAVEAQEARYVFSGDLHPMPPAERVMTTCVFGKTEAHLMQGDLYQLPQVSGKPYFCWVLFSHMGAESIQRRHAAAFVDRLAATGASEVVCFHDDCYAMLAKLAPDYGIEVPFRPVHLSEYLVDYMKAHPQKLKALDMKVAYQRPCASRHTPEKELFIDEVFQMTGVSRVEREFDRENALCCAGVKFLMGQGDPAPDQEKNIVDAKKAGAQALVALCPMCMHSLAGAAAAHGLPIIFIGDLVRMALGEIETPAALSKS